jgi:uncharacterized BrkB/YihY/UPF0761 family membrane protein
MKRIHPPVLLVVFAVIACLNIILPGILQNHLLLGIAISISSLAASSIAVSAYLNQLISSESRATTLSVGNMFESIFQVASTLAFGFLASRFSPEQTFVIIGSVVAALLFVSLLKLFTSYAPQTKTRA